MGVREDERKRECMDLEEYRIRVWQWLVVPGSGSGRREGVRGGGSVAVVVVGSAW